MLERRVDRIEPTVTEVAVLRSEMQRLAQSVDANTVATREVGKQLEQAQMEPHVRSRQFRSAVMIALISASFGVSMALIAGLIAGH